MITVEIQGGSAVATLTDDWDGTNEALLDALERPEVTQLDIDLRALTSLSPLYDLPRLIVVARRALELDKPTKWQFSEPAWKSLCWVGAEIFFFTGESQSAAMVRRLSQSKPYQP